MIGPRKLIHGWIRRTEAKLNAIRPLKNQAERPTTKTDLAKLKYSVLVQVMKKKSPKIKLPISLVSVVVKNSEQIEHDLSQPASVADDPVRRTRQFEFEIKPLGVRLLFPHSCHVTERCT